MIKENDRILLLDGEGNLFLAAAGVGTLNTGRGTLDLRGAIGKSYGDFVQTNQGASVKMLCPRFSDIFYGVVRGPQIITMKDAGLMASYTGLGPGDIVVEGGSGSGAMTVFLAHLVGPTGRVYSYEIRPDFAKLAASNVRASGFSDVVIQKTSSIYEGIEERDIDVVTLDVPEPWRVLPHAASALKPGGYIVAYIPTVDQMEKFGTELYSVKEFAEFSAIEAIVREYQVKPGATRPQTKGLMHTGFLCFARKV